MRIDKHECRPHERHSLCFEGPITNLQVAPAIGNGDVGAVVQVFQNEFRLHLGKNDIWDSRFDHVAEDWVVTQDDLIEMSEEYGFRLEGGAYGGKPTFDKKPPKRLRFIRRGPSWDRDTFPCPKPAGLVRVFNVGGTTTKVSTKVDVSNGVVISRFGAEPGKPGDALIVEAFVDKNKNAIRVKVRNEGGYNSVRLCIEKRPDSIDATMPAPKAAVLSDYVGLVTQTIPAEHGADEFSWALAGSFPKPAKGRTVEPVEQQAYRIYQVCNIEAGAELAFTAGIATDRDGKGACADRAQTLAGAATAGCYSRARRANDKAWARFWDRSGVELGDAQLEATWYRNLFSLACQIRPGAMAPGLAGNTVTWEKSEWHGAFTVNMNIQKMFLSSLPTNHPEWMDCYADWLEHMLPGFRHLAEITFGIKGIHASHMMFPYMKPERQAQSAQCGRAIGMTGWLAQPMMWRWEYTRDRTFLKERAYPYLKEAACFYWRYLKKYLADNGDMRPTLNLEGPPWSKDFERNRDSRVELILFRQTFAYAIEASKILKTDETWRKKWEWGLSKVKPVTLEKLDDGKWWMRADKNDVPPCDPETRASAKVMHAQAVGAAWTVFPAECVEGDEEDGIAPALRQMMQDGQWEVDWHLRHLSLWTCAIPALRMQLPKAFGVAREIILCNRFPEGHACTSFGSPCPETWRAPEDNYLGVVGTTEMLLQSQGNVIRLFPCWPREMPATFRGLPARGGFLVTAEWVPEKGLSARVTSLAGEECRVRWPGKLRITHDGKRIETRQKGRDAVFETRKGASFGLRGSLESL